MVDWVFINSHSYKLILSKRIKAPLRTEGNFTELKWGVTYLLASSMMLIQHGSSGRLYATFSASPSNWWPSTPPDMGSPRNWSQKGKQGQSNVGLSYVHQKACDKWNQSFLHTERAKGLLDTVFVLVWTWVPSFCTFCGRDCGGINVKFKHSSNRLICGAMEQTFSELTDRFTYCICT